jgi:5-methylcytosine-specific restriction endonuclease McrA
MPVKPGRICGYCRQRVASGMACACAQSRRAEAERNKRYEATRLSASARRYDTKWKKERTAFLADHPTCVRCGAPSTVVDHITPHRGDMKLFWSRRNWQPLCTHCHSSTKQREERRPQP